MTSGGAPLSMLQSNAPLPPPAEASPAFRWYCPSPAGYHPEIRECTQAWLRVLPPDAQPQSPPVR